jgi:signal transduction histidine kinase
MKDNAFTRSFIHSRTVLTLWYTIFCLALIAVLNFGAFAAQTASLQTPTKAIGFGAPAETASKGTIAIANTDNTSTVTTVESIRQRFGRTLIIIDSALIVLGFIFSYILSGLTLRPIRKVLQQQEEFAQEASHELRTPLSVIALEVETLRRDDNDSNSDTLNHISDELDRMGRLIDGLLTLVHSHHKTRQTGQARFNLTEAAQAAFSQLQKVAKAKQLTYSFASEYSGEVVAERNDIEQAIGIILQNAIKYSPAGGSISLTVTRHSKYEALVTVRDTGAGIAEEDLPHIFDRFYRSKNTGAHITGLGLGLAIAKKIVTLHKGRVTIESQVGKGTTARIYLHVG